MAAAISSKADLVRSRIDLKGGFETALLRELQVKTVMSTDSETVPVDMGLVQLRENLQRSKTGELFVLRENGELFGTITLADLADAAFDHEVDNLINAGDIARANPPLLDADDDLQTANKLIRDSGEHYIAVVENHDSMLFVGTLHETALMLAYNRALIEVRAQEHNGTP